MRLLARMAAAVTPYRRAIPKRVSPRVTVWVRRPGTPAERAPQPSAWLTEEASQALYGMLRGCDARWMNHPDAARQARHKPWQLRLAQRCGLPVPATVITCRAGLPSPSARATAPTRSRPMSMDFGWICCW